MSETQALLGRIAALRQRLEEAKATSCAGGRGPEPGALPRQIALGAEQNALLDGSLRQLDDAAVPGEDRVLPTRLTLRARRVLERGRELLGRLRELSGLLEATAVPGMGPADDPLRLRYRETASMLNATLRMVQALPEAASAQLRLCEGIEALVAAVAERLAALTVLANRRRREAEQATELAELLDALAREREPDVKRFVALAEQVLASAREAAPLRLVHASPDDLPRFVACHALNVAQVTARVVRHDPDLSARPLDPVLAALIHDAGMLRVPAEVLLTPGPLDDEQRRAVEGHCRQGAEMAARLLPTGAWLAEVVLGHHERLDGTGYPLGLRELQIPPLARLLAVCDVYAALCEPRPHRSARETRTALTDTLLLAEQGLLDRTQAEHLLELSFYPPGTVVELADGCVAAVVATHASRHDLHAPARPVLALLTDSQGRPLALPRYLDLARAEGPAVVRTLSLEERRRVLGRRYPEFV